MHVDNFEQIAQLLDFSTPNTFYFVQVLKRRKENPDMDKGVAVVKNYFLYTPMDLEKLRPKIIESCTKHNARAYINLNRLDGEKIALHVIAKTTQLMIQKEYAAVRNVYSSVCGSHHSEKNKRWVIDIDKEVLHLKNEIITIANRLIEEIARKQAPGEKYRILAEIPTKSGVHVITNPFNIMLFRKELDILLTKHDIETKVDVQKNSPTLLYICSI